MPGGATAGGILRYLTVAGLVLLGLMLSLEVDVGFSAPPLARLLFWVLQIGSGLFVLQSVLYLLTRRFGASRAPSWGLVLLSSVLGAALLTPVYWLIGEGLMERWMGYPARPDDGDSALFAAWSGHPLLAEYLDIVGPLTAAWALICLPRLHWLVPPLLHVPAPPAAPSPLPARLGSPASAVALRSATSAPFSAAPALDDPPPLAAAELVSTRAASGAHRPTRATEAAAPAPPRPAWCDRLPTELGTDVIAVSSELQYLRVWTPRGCALILGALADVESEGGSRGLRVHRSWWVACDHVVSVRRTATGAVCRMSDGREVPVSRRRRAEVLARFGDGAQYWVAPSSKPVAQTELD